jgi:hypothetical protein
LLAHAPAIWPESLTQYAPSPLRAVIVVPVHKNEEEPSGSPAALVEHWDGSA